MQDLYTFFSIFTFPEQINVYVGLIGILVPIVIFIAETLCNNRIETEKRFVIKHTMLEVTLLISIIVLFLNFIGDFISLGSYSDYVQNLTYFIYEIVLNCLVLTSFFLTLIMSYRSINLNIRSEYFDSNYDEYINRTLFKLSKKLNKNRGFNIKKLLGSDNKYISYGTNNDIEYIPINSPSRGMFKGYNTEILHLIINDAIDGRIKNKRFKKNDKPLIVLSLNQVSYIDQGVIIAYILPELVKYTKMVQNSVLFDNIKVYDNSDVLALFKDLFKSFFDKNDDNFDCEQRIIELYNFLYKSKMNYIINLSLQYIRHIFVSKYKDLQDNKKLTHLLISLSHIAYTNRDVENYRFLHTYIYACYSAQLDLSKDSRSVVFDFTTNFLQYEYYSTKKNNDCYYYEIVLSNFLNFIFDLIFRKEFVCVDDIFQNVIFNYDGYINGEANKYDKLDLDFSFGFTLGIIELLMVNEDYTEKDVQGLRNVIKHIKSHFVNIYSFQEALIYFKKIYNSGSLICEVYRNFSFKFIDKRYRNSWSGRHVGDGEILRAYVYIFGLDSYNTEIGSELVTRNNLYFFKNLYELMSSNNFTLSNNFSVEAISINKINIENIEKYLKSLISECELKEKEYNRINKLSDDKVNRFINNIFDKISDRNDLISLLKKCKKITYSTKSFPRNFGFAQIIGREIFFDEVLGYDNISADYAYSIISEFSDIYMKNLDNKSTIINNNIYEYISNISDNEKYVIFTNYDNLKYLKTDKFVSGTTKIANRNVDLIILPKIHNMYLVKKSNLPKVQFHRIVDKEKYLYNKGIFIQLIDLSNNEKFARKIMNDSKWLSEYGGEKEQLNFLKENCFFRLSISPQIINTNEEKILKFIPKWKEE